jgi:hypothetical protein
LKEKLDGMYLLQERIQQHPKLSILHPHSINTIRIVTFNNGGNVQVFFAALRIGAEGRSMDNGDCGGIQAGIDLTSGQVCTEAICKSGHGGQVQQHPDTKVPLYGFEIPYFHDAVQLATDLHGYLYGIHSIGWDIAITPAGPIIIEGNDDWGGIRPMALEKNFKQRFLAMYHA